MCVSGQEGEVNSISNSIIRVCLQLSEKVTKVVGMLGGPVSNLFPRLATIEMLNVYSTRGCRFWKV